MTETNLTSKTINGLKWSYISVVVTAIMQLIYTAVLARLLDPSSFGLVAMGNIIIRFGIYFSRAGVGQALIQKKELSENDIKAGFTLSIIFGLVVTLIIFFLAPLSVYIFEDPNVVPVVQVMAFTLFVAGTSTTAVSLLRRNFSFKALAIAEIAAFTVNLLVAVSMALMGFGVWSLVVSTLAQGTVLTAVSFAYSRHSIKFHFHLSQFKPLLSYGGRISVVSFLEFLNYNIDTMLVGRFLGSDLLGIYNRASYLVNIPALQISTSLAKVLFPTLSKIQSDLKKLREGYYSALLVLGVVLFAFSFGVSAGASEIVQVILGPKWLAAIPVLQILALVVPFNLLVNLTGVLFDAMANLNIKILITSARLIVYFLVLVPLFRFGIIGFAYAFLFTETIFYITYMVLAIRVLKPKLLDVLFIHLFIIGIGILIMGGIFGVSVLFKEINIIMIVTLMCEILVGSIILLFFLYIYPPKLFSNVIRQRFAQYFYQDSPPAVVKFVLNRYMKTV